MDKTPLPSPVSTKRGSKKTPKEHPMPSSTNTHRKLANTTNHLQPPSSCSWLAPLLSSSWCSLSSRLLSCSSLCLMADVTSSASFLCVFVLDVDIGEGRGVLSM